MRQMENMGSGYESKCVAPQNWVELCTLETSTPDGVRPTGICRGRLCFVAGCQIGNFVEKEIICCCFCGWVKLEK